MRSEERGRGGGEERGGRGGGEEEGKVEIVRDTDMGFRCSSLT